MSTTTLCRRRRKKRKGRKKKLAYLPFGKRSRRRLDDGAPHSLVRQISHDRRHLCRPALPRGRAALFLDRGDGGGEVAPLAQAREHQRGAPFARERQRDRAADAAVRARDDGALARERALAPVRGEAKVRRDADLRCHLLLPARGPLRRGLVGGDFFRGRVGPAGVDGRGRGRFGRHCFWLFWFVFGNGKR